MPENTSSLRVTCGQDQTVLEALRAVGAIIESPCGGLGTCGKCRVKIAASAPLPLPDDDECQALGDAQLQEGWRLACRLKGLGDIAVTLPAANDEHRILADGAVQRIECSPSIKKIVCQLPPRGAATNTAWNLWLQAQTAEPLYGTDSLSVLQALAAVRPDEHAAVTLVVEENTLLHVEPGDTSGQMYGFAVDIGTTTVIVSLVNLADGHVLGNASAINPQTQFGLDVLSRIAYAGEQCDRGVRQLQKKIVGCLNKLGLELCRNHGIDPGRVYTIAVAANATMTHLLLGIAPHSLGIAPFAPVFTRALEVPGKDIGLRAFAGARLHTLPGVSAYIGADIVAGAYACGLATMQGNALFIDIGTNGEVVLAAGGKLVSCSCAAGPALEGMNIHHGMRAASGAVEDVLIEKIEGQTGLNISLKTIGETPPVGICGSGVLAAIRELLRAGLVRPDGRMLKADDFAEGDPRRALCVEHQGKAAILLAVAPHQVLITQKDVRQVQLAKGAILSAFTALLQHAEISMEDIDHVLVAGQFGAYLPARSLTACGIIPQCLEDRVRFLGNTSRSGACMALVSQHARKAMERLSQQIDYVELSTRPGYDRLFAASMRFPLV